MVSRKVVSAWLWTLGMLAKVLWDDGETRDINGAYLEHIGWNNKRRVSQTDKQVAFRLLHEKQSVFTKSEFVKTYREITGCGLPEATETYFEWVGR